MSKVLDKINAEINDISLQQHDIFLRNGAVHVTQITSEVERMAWLALQDRKARLNVLTQEYIKLCAQIEALIAQSTPLYNPLFTDAFKSLQMQYTNIRERVNVLTEQ